MSKFKVGDIVKHKHKDYIAVVVIDPNFPEELCLQLRRNVFVDIIESMWELRE